MKSIIKITLIAAIVITAPAHAMFTRLNNIFTPKYTPMYMDRKPLFTLGTLLGAASLTAKKSAQAEVSYNCDFDIANLTFWALRTNDTTSRDKWLKERLDVFNYCKKEGISRDTVYNRNIKHILDHAINHYNAALGGIDPMHNNSMGRVCIETALHLQQEQIQEHNK